VQLTAEVAPGYVYMWEFRVRPERLDEFLRVYGSEGEWARLFGRGDGYLRTDLLQDREDPHRFVTIDSWRSAECWSAFHSCFAAEFAVLDARCEALTLEERSIGVFRPV
jgi:heme-degrading monooxygenase HmoA